MKIMTVPQAAKKLGVSRAYVDQLIRAGRMECEYMGRIRVIKSLRILPASRSVGRPKND
jgi:excisionase family DNA binding protein